MDSSVVPSPLSRVSRKSRCSRVELAEDGAATFVAVVDRVYWLEPRLGVSCTGALAKASTRCDFKRAMASQQADKVV